jgi:hypothetical protein
MCTHSPRSWKNTKIKLEIWDSQQTEEVGHASCLHCNTSNVKQQSHSDILISVSHLSFSWYNGNSSIPATQGSLLACWGIYMVGGLSHIGICEEGGVKCFQTGSDNHRWHLYSSMWVYQFGPSECVGTVQWTSFEHRYKPRKSKIYSDMMQRDLGTIWKSAMVWDSLTIQSDAD